MQKKRWFWPVLILNGVLLMLLAWFTTWPQERALLVDLSQASKGYYLLILAKDEAYCLARIETLKQQRRIDDHWLVGPYAQMPEILRAEAAIKDCATNTYILNKSEEEEML